MKKGTAFIDAILSLIPLGNLLIIKTDVVLSMMGLILSVPKKINAETFKVYFDLGYDKNKEGDYYGAISDYTKAIEIDPNQSNVFKNRTLVKETIGDIEGACLDAKKSVYLGDTASYN